MGDSGTGSDVHGTGTGVCVTGDRSLTCGVVGAWGTAAQREGKWELKSFTIMVNFLATCQGCPVYWRWLSTGNSRWQKGDL